MNEHREVSPKLVVSSQQLSFWPSDEVEAPDWCAPMALVPQQVLTADSPLATALHWYQQELVRRNYAKNTCQTYAKAGALLLRFFGTGRTLRSITPHDLKGFQAWVESKACSPKTAEVKLTAVRTLFRLLYEQHVLPLDTARDMRPAKTRAAPPLVLTGVQAEAVRHAAAKRDSLSAVAVMLMLDMGLRVGEVANLHVDDVDVSDPSRPVVCVHYKDPRHAAKIRQLIGPPMLTELVLQRRKACLEEGKVHLVGVSCRRLQQLVGEIGREAGLQRALTPQMLRWTYAYNQLQAGVDGEILRRRLGLSLLGWRDACRKIAQLGHPV